MELYRRRSAAGRAPLRAFTPDRTFALAREVAAEARA